ncbi:MAG: sigma-70 family RNA polymerase sigma factor [candidate division Zixibacteria bacterium]|nr:sigma-70 family RNA polymerase sigma factor [candidate division Zixibacteria bacterium]
MIKKKEDKGLDDQALIKEALKGKQEAYKTLMERHRNGVQYIIFRLVRNRDESLDLVQETFLKAFSSLVNYKSKFRFTTWLYRIAANCSIDYLRRKKIDSLSLDQHLETEKGTLEIQIPDRTYDPEKDLTLKQQELSIEEAINSLPKKYREVIEMRHKEDKSYEEIALLLHISVGTVKARIFRARVLLKKKLKFMR